MKAGIEDNTFADSGSKVRAPSKYEVALSDSEVAFSDSDSEVDPDVAALLERTQQILAGKVQPQQKKQIVQQPLDYSRIVKGAAIGLAATYFFPDVVMNLTSNLVDTGLKIGASYFLGQIVRGLFEPEIIQLAQMPPDFLDIEYLAEIVPTAADMKYYGQMTQDSAEMYFLPGISFAKVFSQNIQEDLKGLGFPQEAMMPGLLITNLVLGHYNLSPYTFGNMAMPYYANEYGNMVYVLAPMILKAPIVEKAESCISWMWDKVRGTTPNLKEEIDIGTSSTLRIK